MLSERSGVWETGALENPFGRSVMFQVFIAEIRSAHKAITRPAGRLKAVPARCGAAMAIARVEASAKLSSAIPDGYLVMLAENLRERLLA